MAETTASHSTSDLPKIGAPATRALADAGITRLEQLTTLAEDDVLQLHGVGPKAINIKILKEALTHRRLSLVQPEPR
jgi:hypothetical protein